MGLGALSAVVCGGALALNERATLFFFIPFTVYFLLIGGGLTFIASAREASKRGARKATPGYIAGGLLLFLAMGSLTERALTPNPAPAAAKPQPSLPDLPPTLQDFLSQTATETNKSLPTMVDTETELSRLSASDSTLVYNYRLVTLAASESLASDIINVIRPTATKAACTTPAVRQPFLDKGATLRYSYSDQDGVYIGAFDVTRSDC